MAILAHSAATAAGGRGADEAQPRDALPASAAVEDLDALVVRIEMNDRFLADSDIVFRAQDGVWFIPEALLSQAGVTVGEPPEQIDGLVYRRLQAGPGISFDYDPSAASLSLAVAPQHFEGQQVVAQTPPPPLAEGKTVPAAFFNYDVGARYTSGEFAVDGAASVGVSGDFGLALSQWGFSSAGEGSLLRLGTSLTIDDPDRRTTLVLGDTVEASAPGMAPLGFGGVGWFSNFETDPSFIAMPQPYVNGALFAPGEVNVFVDERNAYSGEIEEGDFLISDLPASAGAAQLKVVTRDIAGRETSVVEPFYVAPDLLKPGLSAYSFAAGWLHGESDSAGLSYGPLFARGGYRRGLSDWLTVNSAGEANGDVADIALGADMRLGALGAASLGFGASHAMDGAANGYSLTGAFNRSAGDFSFGLGGHYASRDFTQIGAGEGAKLKTRFDGQASVALAGGTASAGASFMDRWGADSILLARLQFTRDLGPGQLTLGGGYVASDEDASEIRASYTLPLGGGFASSNIVRASDGSLSGGVAAGHSAPPDEGVGYGVNIDASDEGADARARIMLRKHVVEGALEGAYRNGKAAIRAHARGGLMFTDGVLFVSRDVGNGALLIETPGLEGAPVRLNNQEMGRTRKDGKALLPAQPFTHHTVALDDSGLPIDVSLRESSAKLATGRGRVTKYRFSMAQNFAQMVILKTPDGVEAPRGTTIAAEGEPAPLPVGHDGVAYLTSDTPQRAYALVIENGRCEFHVDFEEFKSREHEDGALPVVVCAGVQRNDFVENERRNEQPAAPLLRDASRRPLLATAGEPTRAKRPVGRPAGLKTRSALIDVSPNVRRPALRWGSDERRAKRSLFNRWRYARMAVVTFADGREPPRGMRLRADGQYQKFAIAYDGLAFLTSDERRKSYYLYTEKGPCSFDVNFDKLRTGENDNGVWPVYVCR